MAELFAWMVLEPDSREGIIGAALPSIGSGFTPLIARSPEMAQRLKGFAEAHADASGKPVRLVRFVEAETVEWLTAR